MTSSIKFYSVNRFHWFSQMRPYKALKYLLLIYF